MTFVVHDRTSFDSSTWTGLTVDAGNVITGGLGLANLAPGFSGELVMGDGTLGTDGHIYLHVVPEPGSAALLIGAAGTLLGMRRRRRA
ncbi:MAG: PEP-CTERM sorting domain-containing protein [Chthoniobacteraceae bacterium]